MNRSIPAGSGSSRAVRRLLPSASHRGRLKRLFSTARSITVPACGTFVLAVLLAGLPAHAQRGCGAGGPALGPALEPEMVFIPGGSFRQGGGRAHAEPVHTVNVQLFAVGKYEITRAQFEAFVDETGHAGSLWRNPGFIQTGQHPVVGVNWNDVRAYIAWLNRRTGKRYRLLTESEWEYVARAGTETLYHFGNDAASFKGKANCVESVCADGFDRRTAPVGSFGANAFGLHDMYGNVWERVEDCWHENYEGAPTDGSAWLEGDGGDCNSRVLRGGAWSSGLAGGLRAVDRGRFDRGGRFNSGGFRVAQDL